MDNETDLQALEREAAEARAALAEAGLMGDAIAEPAPSASFDAPELDGLDFYTPAHGRRYRRQVRTETRSHRREVRPYEVIGTEEIDPEYMRRRGRDPEPFRRWNPVTGRHYYATSVVMYGPPRVETWEEEATISLPLGRELDDREETLARLLEEPRGGFNGGRAATLGPDAEEARHELGREGMQRADFLSAGGWHLEWPEPTGGPVGRPRIDVKLSPEDEDGIIERVGVDPDTWARLFRQGRKTAADLEARAWVEAAVAELMRRGRGRGIERTLIKVYGCPRSTLYDIARRGRAHDLKPDVNP